MRYTIKEIAKLLEQGQRQVNLNSLTERERQPPNTPTINSERFHDHPSHPSSCLVYEEFYNRKCPCRHYKG